MANPSEFIFSNVKAHLIALGLGEAQAASCARKGVEHWERAVGSSKNPFNEACDYAGMMAEQVCLGFKYKSPKATSKPRNKRPPDALDLRGGGKIGN